MARGDEDPSLDGGDDNDGFDLTRFKELAGFLVRAPGRRPLTAFASLFVTLALGLLVATYWPRSYACDVRILAQNNLVLPALGNPTRAVPRDADVPTKNAADAILRHDNIVAVIHELDLVNRWQETRQPILRLKDKIMGGGSKNDGERLRDMTEVLASRLVVTSDDSSITIAIVWPDAKTAFEILSLLQKDFLEARYHNNVDVIVEAIRILEERSKPQASEVDSALAELLECEAARNLASHHDAPSASTRPPLRSSGEGRSSQAPVVAAQNGDVETPNSTIAEELRDVRHRSQILKDDRDRQRSEAQRQLTDARATLGPRHPVVVALNETIGKLAEPVPELEVLDQRERTLVGELASAGAHSPAPPSSDGQRTPSPRIASRPAATPDPVAPVDVRDDARTTLARAQVQSASAKYSELLSRVEAAKIELEVTRAAFKFQYIVVRPPELPRRPSKPNVTLVIVASVILSFVMGLFVPAALDILRGRFIEVWQVERQLALPILGRLSPPS